MHYKNYSFDNIPELNEHIIEDNAIEILKMRYFMTFKDGFKETKFSQLCRRVARVIASSEYNYYYNAENENEFLNRVNNIEESIYNDMMSHRFLFNSPALFSAGSGLESKHFENDITDADTYRYIMNNATQNQMMFACFTLPVDDSLDGIFDSAKNAAIISKFGGGVGANFGNLREKDALIKDGIAGKSSGPISFMQVWNTMGSVVVQGGKRRAALMGMLYSNHPDIEEFVTCKTEDGNLNYFNISVAIDNDFMQAVENDLDYCLISPKNNKIIKTIKAKDLWDKICTSAHKRGDPGIFFVDLANEDSLIKDPTNKYKIESTNPCLTGNTLIETATGKKRIDEITINDYVLTMDIKTKTFIYEKVEFSDCTKKDANIIELELEDGKKITLTPEHKVFTENRGYIKASQLTNEDLIIILE